jgi:hypothetical protein
MAIKVNGYGYLTGSVYGLAWQGATLPTGAGMEAGQVIVAANGNGLESVNQCMLVQSYLSSSGTFVANCALQFITGGASTIPFEVDLATAQTTPLVGCNDLSAVAGSSVLGGATITKGNYFYMTCSGDNAFLNMNVANSTTLGTCLVPTTAGAMTGWSSGVATVAICAVANSSGATALRAVYCP